MGYTYKVDGNTQLQELKAFITSRIGIGNGIGISNGNGI